MDKITYNPGIINKIGKKILSLARFIMSENSFKNFMLYVHAIYKSLQRNKYLIYLLVKFIFLSKNDKKKYYYVYKLFVLFFWKCNTLLSDLKKIKIMDF